MFTHLHLHTEYSLLDGACRIEPLVLRAKELGMTSLAITDHGNMYGAVDFYKTCKKHGIKPIIGCEVYVAPRTRFDREKVLDKDYNHLILLCENEKGYKNLIKLVSLSYTEGYYYKPRVDHDILEKYHEGLICLSACLAGEIPQAILERDYERAKNTALWYRDVFGEENYFLELQDHGIKEQKIVAEGIKRLNSETGIPLVVTNDVHYIEKEDSKIQQVLICIATNHVIGEDTGLEFHSQEFYLKSEEEMKKLFPELPEAIKNTGKIAERCNFDFEFGKTKLPYFEINEDISHFEYFRRLCYEGLEKRYTDPPQEYKDRLEYELETVNKMGYTDYYLIVADFVSFAKAQGIPVGPGRGSGAGSLAAYCMGITDLDPMKYNLLFERFLNPERVSMPDFDIDFCYERRQEVIDYVTRKYGADHVAQIVTFGTLQTRAAIRDVGRAMGMPYSAVDAVAKLVPNEYKITIDDAVKSSKLRELMDQDARVAELIDTARKVEGMPRNTSTHAAGVVITHDPVSSYVPLATNDGLVVTQYIMTELEELGLLKMDFLGLRTLTVIDVASKNAGIDINKIPIDDPEVYKLFSRGQTEGIFQFESSGMKQMLMNLKPTKLEHLIAANSLYRPGPAKQIDTFVENSHHPEKVHYSVPQLKPILDDTFGCIVYQEQVMQILRSLAGYSYGRADVVRRAMSKKKKDVMEAERKNFIDGCAKNNIDSDTANSIFDQITEFAKYAFNKSHAACYALVAYRTAYLKLYYPAQFIAALLTSVLDSSNKVARYIAEGKRLGLRLAVPDVNTSMKGFSANGKFINYGLLGIKNLGTDFIDDIINERKNGRFKDFFDFCRRLQTSHYNRRAVESLIRSGALDSLGANRRQMLQALPVVSANLEEQRRKTMYGQVGFFELGSGGDSFGVEFELPQVDEFPKTELLKMEKEMTGLYLSGHPLDKYESAINALGYAKTAELLEAGKSDFSKYKDGDTVILCGIITHITIKQTRNGQNMAFVTLEDLLGSLEIIVFPKILETASEMLFVSGVITVKGTLSVEEEKEPKILANVILGAPDKNSVAVAQNVSENTPVNHKKGKHRGLFLRFEDENDHRIEKAKVIASIFEGDFPLYFYFKDKKHYERQSRDYFTQPNKTMLGELVRLLGSENVAFIE